MTASEWIALAAVGISLLSLVVAWSASRRSNQTQARMAEIDEERRAEETRAAREAQARLVSAWVAGVVRPSSRRFPPSVKVECRNESSAPVTGVFVEVCPDWSMTDGVSSHVGTVAPGETKRVSVPLEVDRELLTDPPVRICFTDADAREWQRDERGRLGPADESWDSRC